MDLVEVCARDIFKYHGISNFHGFTFASHPHDSYLGSVSSKADPVFVTTGFCNWIKGMEKFMDHES